MFIKIRSQYEGEKILETRINIRDLRKTEVEWTNETKSSRRLKLHYMDRTIEYVFGEKKIDAILKELDKVTITVENE